jgi:hypothetical protein
MAKYIAYQLYPTQRRNWPRCRECGQYLDREDRPGKPPIFGPCKESPCSAFLAKATGPVIVVVVLLVTLAGGASGVSGRVQQVRTADDQAGAQQLEVGVGAVRERMLRGATGSREEGDVDGGRGMGAPRARAFSGERPANKEELQQLRGVVSTDGGERPDAGGDRVSIEGRATHYCRTYTDCGYAGQPLGCGGGVYDPYDPTIVAVGPARYAEWPCGVQLQVCARGLEVPRMGSGEKGPGAFAKQGRDEMSVVRCITVVRHDSCPGCGPYLIDLSEAAFEIVCGDLERGVCAVSISVEGER